MLYNTYGKMCLCVIAFIHGKNNFDEVSKNLAKYRSKNNFVKLLQL